jgi:hypothetical protein
MKKLIVLLAVSLFVINANAQKQNEANVPDGVKAKFAEMFPNVKDVKWEKEKANYEAEFEIEKVETSAEFDESGAWLQTETHLDVDKLPDNIKDYFAKKLPGKKIAEASVISLANGSICFEADVGSKDYIFDEGGNLLSTETKDKDDNADKKK